MVLLINAQKKSPSFSNHETELFLKINKGIPFELQQKYNRLIAKRDKSELTQNEYKELLRLTDKVEQFEAKRIKYLSQLAKLRKTTLSNLFFVTTLQRGNENQPPTFMNWVITF